jgi:drug/metabolite transporter (DMT)-like permease
MRTAGIVIVIIGLLIVIFTGLIFTTQETLVEVGNLELQQEQEHSLNFSPWIGVAIMAIGAVVWFAGSRR